MKHLVFDTSVLSHFARANHLAALKALAGSFQCIVPGEVVSELMVGVTDYPAIGDAIGLDWVELVTLEDLEVVLEFAKYKAEFGGGAAKNSGEAAVLAWCKVEGGIAVVDDAVAVRAAKRDGIETHGTLWLVMNGLREDVLTRPEAEAMVDDLGATDMRLPTDGKGFLAWAYREGLLK